MSVRIPLGVPLAIALVAAGCGGDGDSVATSDSAPVTLGQLDGVVITVAPDDLAGEPVRLEDVDGDGQVEIVDAEIIGDEAATSSDDDTVTRIEATVDDGRAGQDDPDDQDDSEDDGLNPLGGDDPEDKRMPDVVCMGLQDAQDEIQDRGVFFSKSEDATGDGRRQLWDRNWIVVAQDPEPGVSIGENEAVLYVVKKNEDNDC